MPEQPPPPPTDIGQASPPTLDHVVGQRAVVSQVKVALEAAFADNTRACHMLLTGAPGLGKTLLAQIVAREMASDYHETLGQSLAQPSDLYGLLLQATDRSIVFVDEADELPPSIQTTLYRAVEEKKLFLPQSSSGRGAKTIPLADFTLLLASNHEHSLVQPLRDRLKLILRFEPYTEDELNELVRQRARALRWDVDDDVLRLIAGRGRGTPRLALRLLESCRRTCRSESETAIRRHHFDRTCELEGIDGLGLDRQEIQLLRILEDAAGAVRLNVIASRLGLPARTVSEVVERHLVQLGLIDKAPDGRRITAKGLAHLRGGASTPSLASMA
jgi:Holliday junction DNA helicase RuvB